MNESPKPISGSTPAENMLFQRFHIQLKHLPSGENVYFKAMLTQFEDQYTSDWNTEQVFGRMDPIRSFRGTQRQITLGWDVVAASLAESRHNLAECSKFLRMLYPSYGNATVTAKLSDNPAPANGSTTQEAAQERITESLKDAPPSPQNAATIKGAPLFKLKFANLIQSSAAKLNASNSIEAGLVGTIDGLTYAPDVEQGFFDPVEGANNSILYPQTIKLSFGFMVSHEHPLGWDANGGRFRSDGSFPYPNPQGSGGNE
tara:strand:- start:243 stop:1019 length:777 start_codon:yes stop_codon:yes gene_type:complete